MKYKLILGFLALLFVPLVSAYNSLFGYYSNPLDLLMGSEWVRFLLLFAFFFAVIFYAVKNMFKGNENKGIAMVISICVALVVTLALAERGLISGYFGNDLGNWALLLAGLLMLAFIIRLAYKNFGPKFTGAILIFLWILFAFYFNPSGFFTYGTPGDLANLIYSLWISVPGAIITFIIALALFFKKPKHPFWNRNLGHLAAHPYGHHY